MIAYEVAVVGLAFTAAVSKELEGSLAKRVAGHVELLLLNRLTRYEARYRKYLAQKHAVSNLKGLPTQGPKNPPLEDVFVDVSLRPSTLHAAQRSSLADVEPELGSGERLSLQHLLDQPRQRTLVIIGAPGTGKTTLLQHTAVVLARRKAQRRARRELPVFVPLRDHVRHIVDGIAAGSAVTIASLARQTVTNANLDDAPAGWFDEQLERGCCVVLLDGLDEVADPYARQQLIQWTEMQIARYPDNHWVLTTRPHGYEAAPLNGAEALVVRRFTPDQISRFVQAWYAATGTIAGDTGAAARASAGNLLDRLHAQPSLYGLASNPLLLTMLCNVHRYRGALPGTRAQLYFEICQVLLRSRYEGKGLREEAQAGPAREVVLRELAFGMMVHQIQSISDEGPLTDDLLSLALGRECPGVSAGAFLVAVARTGLLIERQPGQFSFAHQTFQEYLAAAHIHWRGPSHYLRQKVTDPWWRETTLLWAAMNDPSDVINACLNHDTAESLALALDCYDEAGHTPPRRLRRRLEQVRRDALRSPDGERRRLMVGVTLARHLRQTIWLADGLLVSARPISNTIFRMLPDALRELARINSPDDMRLPDGDDDATAVGVPEVYAKMLVDWVNEQLDGSATFRVPTWDEANDPAMRPLVPSRCSLWVSPPDSSHFTRHRGWVSWAPKGTPHPWLVPMERVRERMRVAEHLLTSNAGSSRPELGELVGFTEIHPVGSSKFEKQWRLVNIPQDTSEPPPAPDLRGQVRVMVHEVAHRHPGLAHGLQQVVRQLPPEGERQHPATAEAIRRAALHVAQLTRNENAHLACRDIIVGITALQDRGEGLIPPREVVLLVRA
ncbi:NACHT domain-containing protein [Actinomycetota bacterium Odt1-20B]